MTKGRAPMEDTGKNLESIQEMNRTLILKLLQRNRLCSRARLAKQSGLKQATITNIINDFISWDIVREQVDWAYHKRPKVFCSRRKADTPVLQRWVIQHCWG